jgi:hypothetical protein
VRREHLLRRPAWNGRRAIRGNAWGVVRLAEGSPTHR